MSKNTVKLTNCTVNLEVEHENYKNGRLSVIVEYEDDFLTPIDIEHTVLKNTGAVKKIADILESSCIIDFTDDDCKKICDIGRQLMSTPVNVAQKMRIKDLVREIYYYHLRYCKKYHLNALQGQKALTYIRENDGVKYLCVNYYKALQYILDDIHSGWKATEFKKMAIRVFDLWANGDLYHRGLYQNRTAGEEWSIRIPLKDFLTKEEMAVLENPSEDTEELKEVA